ncbi:MAG: hypothetical protein CBB71_13850 [Rhodopirellula sp. TMED11]|nr:MAG: hypothetical protein CBB71_13850 [Rhodopirellula sp. TMED11]
MERLACFIGNLLILNVNVKKVRFETEAGDRSKTEAGDRGKTEAGLRLDRRNQSNSATKPKVLSRAAGLAKNSDCTQHSG